jgi:MFS family permease
LGNHDVNPSQVPHSPSALSSMIRSLRHRNFRLFFVGQGISLVGTWMQSIALPWLVYRLTGSVVLLGVVGFTGQILTFVLAPLAGVLADRWNRRRMVIATQVLALAQALALAALTLGGVIEVWQIILLSLIGGLERGFEIPVRQSFVVEMLEDRADLPNAIALNSFLVNGARLVGPSLAGGIIAAAGEGLCFLLNGLSYIAVIAALVAMRLVPREAPTAKTPLLKGLAEGWRYMVRSPPIRSVLLLVGVISLMGIPYTTLMPVFARDILHGGASTMGLLVGATGVGALAGAMVLASRRGIANFARLIAFAAAAFGAGLIAFSLAQQFWLCLVILAWIGGAMIVQLAMSNTMLQTVVEEDKRGRVMSFYTMAFMGMGPFGSMLAGGLAKWLGAPVTVALGGGACVLAAIVFAAFLPGPGPASGPRADRVPLPDAAPPVA